MHLIWNAIYLTRSLTYSLRIIWEIGTYAGFRYISSLGDVFAGLFVGDLHFLSSNHFQKNRSGKAMWKQLQQLDSAVQRKKNSCVSKQREAGGLDGWIEESYLLCISAYVYVSNSTTLPDHKQMTWKNKLIVWKHHIFLWIFMNFFLLR